MIPGFGIHWISDRSQKTPIVFPPISETVSLLRTNINASIHLKIIEIMGFETLVLLGARKLVNSKGIENMSLKNKELTS
jgi:hypothetical protein